MKNKDLLNVFPAHFKRGRMNADEMLRKEDNKLCCKFQQVSIHEGSKKATDTCASNS